MYNRSSSAFIGLLKISFLLAAFFTAQAVKAQDHKQQDLQALIDSKEFVFKAQSVFPQRGNVRQLTSEYDLTLSADSIRSYLPYFGRAYSAPIGTAGGGIEFTATDFSYAVQKKKKGWEITILPKDAGDVRQLFLSIGNGGYANLQVTSNNRESITFYGVITGRK